MPFFPVNKKISEFQQKTSLSGSDLLTFVSNGVNYSITYDNFITGLGVSGTISPTSAGVQVLDQPTPNTNIIRNIETKKGLIASVSPQNGVHISTDFENIGSGVSVIKDLLADKYQFRTITAGTGISVGVVNDAIQISATETGSTKTVVVSSEADFPPAVGGVIKLADNTDYLLANDVVTASRFNAGVNTVIRAAGSPVIKLTYTGTGAMFSGDNPNIRIERITLGAPNGSLFAITSSLGNGIVQLLESTVDNCQSIGSFADLFLLRFDSVAWQSIVSSGIQLSGTIVNLDIDRQISFQNTGIAFDLGSAIVVNGAIGTYVNLGGPGATFMSGLTGGGNVPPGSFFTVTNCRLNDMTPLSGISEDDNRYQFVGNDKIQDTRPDAVISLTGNTTATVITATNTPVKVAGTWVEGRKSHFTTDSTGTITFVGEKPLVTPIGLTASLLGASGTDKQATAYIAINGSVVAATGVQVTMNSSKAGNATCLWQAKLNPGDTVEAWVENNSDTIDIIVQNAVLRVN